MNFVAQIHNKENIDHPATKKATKTSIDTLIQ
jgi:hypothetical protein